jgi:hypothetical protein
MAELGNSTATLTKKMGWKPRDCAGFGELSDLDATQERGSLMPARLQVILLERPDVHR